MMNVELCGKIWFSFILPSLSLSISHFPVCFISTEISLMNTQKAKGQLEFHYIRELLMLLLLQKCKEKINSVFNTIFSAVLLSPLKLFSVRANLLAFSGYFTKCGQGNILHVLCIIIFFYFILICLQVSLVRCCIFICFNSFSYYVAYFMGGRGATVAAAALCIVVAFVAASKCHQQLHLQNDHSFGSSQTFQLVFLFVFFLFFVFCFLFFQCFAVSLCWINLLDFKMGKCNTYTIIFVP